MREIKGGMIPDPATITRLCIRAGVKESWEEGEKCPNASPLTLTRLRKGPRNQKKKGVIVEADSRDEEENARQEEDTLMVEDQEEQDPETKPEGNTSKFAEDIELDERSPIDFTTPLASSPPMRNRENNQIMEMPISMQKSMEEREKKWSLQQKFREEVYEEELKRRDQQWEAELNIKEEVYEAELKRKEQKWEEELRRKEERLKKILKHQEGNEGKRSRSAEKVAA